MLKSPLCTFTVIELVPHSTPISLHTLVSSRATTHRRVFPSTALASLRMDCSECGGAYMISVAFSPAKTEGTCLATTTAPTSTTLVSTRINTRKKWCRSMLHNESITAKAFSLQILPQTDSENVICILCSKVLNGEDQSQRQHEADLQAPGAFSGEQVTLAGETCASIGHHSEFIN